MGRKKWQWHRPFINNQDRIESGHKPKLDKQIDRHHPACRSRVEQMSDNITNALFQELHRPYHRVFGNALMQEALLQLLKINWPVLSDNYKKDIQELIDMHDQYVYKDGIYIKK